METLGMLIATTLCLSGPMTSSGSEALDSLTIERCEVHVIPEYDIQVPALHEGQLRSIEHHEGASVEIGATLAQIDDTQAKAQREVVLQESLIASEQASNEINVRYAEAAFDVAKQQFEMVRSANQGLDNVVTKSELCQRWIEMKRTHLQIEQAHFDVHAARMTAAAHKAAVQVADTEIARHLVRAPFDGQVVEVLRHPGEWVSPGDPVFRLCRIDQMRVRGRVPVSAVDPHEVMHHPVQVTVELARGRSATFEGKIVYVPPHVSGGLEFDVWADVKNRQENGMWLLQDGREVSMTIGLAESPAEVPVAALD